MSEFHVFSAKIYRVGIIRYVDLPAEISRAFGKNAPHVPVRGEVQGLPVRTTLVSRGRGCFRMAIHSDIRKKLKVDFGAYIEIALERDEESREPALPPALILSLRQSPKAQAEFRRMTTALRRQIVRYLTAVKQQATLERRVTKFTKRLEQMSAERAKKKNKK